MTPDIEYMFKRNETVENFTNRVIDYCKNSFTNIDKFLPHELKKLYDEAFTEGQLSALDDKDQKYIKEETLF